MMGPRFRTHAGWLVVAAALLTPVEARAVDLDDEQQPSSEMPEPAAAKDVDLFATRRWAFEVHSGFGTPVGLGGAVVEYAVLPFLGFGAGAGVGSAPAHGNSFHGAVLVRARPLRGLTDALVLGGAYSFGGYHELLLFPVTSDLPNDYFEARGNWAQWAQADVGWEHRWAPGFVFRLSMGAAWLLNPTDLTCYNPPNQPSSRCASSHSETLVTFDIAVGYSL
jgi:hypothetical protein